MGYSVKVGIIGFGTVGCGVAKILLENRELIRERSGVNVELVKIADKDLERPRPYSVPEELLTKDAMDIIDNPEVDIVVELVGGVETAYKFVSEAIKRGKQIVTANKALLAERGSELFQQAYEKGVSLKFEASVAGGIPIIKILQESLAGNRIRKVYGIINGTANYILTRMAEEGVSFKEALQEAQKQGYAEADPTLDIEGVDSAHKIVILASLAFGTWVDFKDVYVEGISKITQQDIKYADEFGYTVKLLAIAKDEDGFCQVRVHPTLVPKQHPLSSIRGVYNACYVEGDAVGDVLFYGQGAGMMAAGSAVVGDIIDLARDLKDGVKCRVSPAIVTDKRKSMRRMEETVMRYYFRFAALDKPGVLGSIAGVLGKFSISIASVIQKGRSQGDGQTVPIVMMTHEAREFDVRCALEEIEKLPVVDGKTVVIRAEDF